MRCNCESSLCDHTRIGGTVTPCKRPADPRLKMWGVGTTCTQCASNMCATGGSNYISTIEEES